jgi:hypothetical protein
MVGQQDKQGRWKRLSELARRFDVPVKSVMDEVDIAELVLYHLLVLARMDNLDLSMKLGSSDASTLVEADASTKISLSHAWAKKNWISCVKVVEPKQGKRLPKTPPAVDDTPAYRKCLSRVLMKTTGMGIETIRGNSSPSTHRLTFRSFWMELGINVRKYAPWLVGPDVDDFGTCPISRTQCDVCGTDGPEVDCIMQDGLWRCTVTPTMYTEIHRDMTKPVDVGSMKVFAQNVAARNAKVVLARPVAMVIEEVDEFPAVGLLLRSLGFAQGFATREEVTPKQLTTAAELLLSEQDRLHIEGALGVRLPETWNGMDTICKTLRKILLETSYRLYLVRSRKPGKPIVSMRLARMM